MDPLPSGGIGKRASAARPYASLVSGQSDAQPARAAEAGTVFRQQGTGGGRIAAVLAAGGGAAGAALGRPGSRTQAAMQAAAAVLHGRLAAAAAGASTDPAAGSGQKIAGCSAVAEPAAALCWRFVGRERGRRNRRKKPMPSDGEQSERTVGHGGLHGLG